MSKLEASQPVPTLKTGFAHTHPDPISGAKYSAAELMPGDRAVLVLDQRKLPREERYEQLTTVEQVAEAIAKLVVRGAPAIGVAAAYGMVLAAGQEKGGAEAFVRAMDEARLRLVRTRPTAVNLAWATSRMQRAAEEVARASHATRALRMAEEARAIHREDVAACRKIGQLGAENVPDGATILTHCNAGALATGGYGTALGVVRAAREAGKRVQVVADETRPVLQGARLTAWELAKDGIPVTLIADNMVAQLMARRGVDLVVVGADRIARSGDVANKIGTYGVACLAKMHDVPFDVAAPWSTVDLECEDGSKIPIEERSAREMLAIPAGELEIPIAPEGAQVMNPAFDVTPARLIRAIYTERGVVRPVGDAALLALE